MRKLIRMMVTRNRDEVSSGRRRMASLQMRQITLFLFYSTYCCFCVTVVDAEDKQFGITRNATSKSALFRRITIDRKLDLSPIVLYENCKLKDCGKYCIRNFACSAFNFRKSANKCELLKVDRNTKSDGEHFIDTSGWTYYDTGFNIRHLNWRHKALVSRFFFFFFFFPSSLLRFFLLSI